MMDFVLVSGLKGMRLLFRVEKSIELSVLFDDSFRVKMCKEKDIIDAFCLQFVDCASVKVSLYCMVIYK
jgi:hypothetical protein